MYHVSNYNKFTRLPVPPTHRARRGLVCGVAAMIAAIAGADVPAPVGRRDAPMYHEFRQPEYPFTEATVDLRGLAPVGNTNHVVPRALLINLSPDVTVCFDTELLRVAAIWTGNSVSSESMAALSYANPLKKIRRGQSDRLPQPTGTIVAANGLYPGWQWEGFTHFDDPRPVGPDAKEFGRGPLSAQHSRWRGVEVTGDRARLHYLAANRSVMEDFDLIEADGRLMVRRTVTITPGLRSARFVVAERSVESLPITIDGAKSGWENDRYLLAQVPASPTPQTVHVHYALPTDQPIDRRNLAAMREDTAVVTTAFVPGDSRPGLAVDELALPYPNPWQRRIRPTDIDFWPNGDAVVVTFDGDVYRLSGLDQAQGPVTWRRIATGLNEPQSVRIRDGEVYVFSRLGIIHLVDADSDGVTDFYGCFSNGMLQSPQPRDYPLSMVVQTDGSFLITKGGIQETAHAPQSGRALWVSSDGREVRVFADGLRNAYLGRDPVSGLVTASDQQGNWVPATPLHLIRERGFYGFEPGTDHVRPPESVPLWLPHRVAQSAIDPIWTNDDRLGPLNRSVLMVDYYRPGLVKIMPTIEANSLQAAAVPLDITFETPLLKGEVNPADGQLYFVGMQIWGSLAPRIEGLSRLRVVSPSPHVPVAARVYREGVLIRFPEALDSTTARDPSNYLATAWNYQRSSDYGSGQFRANGTPGVDLWSIPAALLSADRHAVFLAMPHVSPMMQLEVKLRLPDGGWLPVYFTVDEPSAFDATSAGFAEIDFSSLLTTPASSAVTALTETDGESSIALGQTTVERFGCIGCHSSDGTTEGKSGPTWLGLFGRPRPLDNGQSVIADDPYLRAAILDPTAQIVAGYDPQEAGMPPYRGVLSETELESILLYLKSLK